VPYVNSRGVRIHYKIEGDGPPLVLQHGFTQNLERWYECGYVDLLKLHFRLILIDARGHGASDKPHDRAAYAGATSLKDVVAVLDALELRQASYWGYSMGGRIGFGLAKYAPARIQAFVIGGAGAGAMDMESFLKGIDGSDPEAFVAAFESRLGEQFAPEFKAILLKSDTRAYVAAGQNSPSMMDFLPGIMAPCLLYAGDADSFFPGALASAREIPGATFVPLPGLNHAETFRRSDLVVPIVRNFLAAHAITALPRAGRP
jgi:pimeloyl-ACP methyl ester carboxylesterase